MSFKDIKLYKPEDFKKEQFQGKACFSYEYKKYGFYENWNVALKILDNLPEKYKLFCELIPPKTPVKPYFDIEWYDHEFPDYDKDEVLIILKKAIREIIQEVWDIKITLSDYYILNCHRETSKGYKNSFHIIISTDNSIVFKEATECLFLAKKLREKIEIDENIVDLNVYKKFQNFRMLGHSKRDENTPMEKNDKHKNQIDDKHYQITYITPLHTFLPVEEQENPNSLKISSTKEINIEDTDLIEKITELLKKIHPTIYFTGRIDSKNFINFSYTDRLETCYSDPTRTHDNLNIWAFIRENGSVYSGCYSANCRDESGKSLTKFIGNINIDFQEEDKKYLPVTFDPNITVSTEILNSELFKDSFGLSNIFNNIYLYPIKRIKWIESGTRNGTTYFWNGKIWKEDSFNWLLRLISEQIPYVINKHIKNHKGDDINDTESNFSLVDDSDEKIKHYRRIMQRLYSGNINNSIINFIKPNMFDPYFEKIKDIHPGKLSCLNGLLDLKTKILRNCEPNDNITKTLEIEYDPEKYGSTNSNYQKFDTFIKNVTRNKEGQLSDIMYNFMKWSLGYALQGNPKRKIFYIFWGAQGYNGKSLLLNTINNVLQHYSLTIDKTVVMQAPKANSGAASPHLMALENKRFGILPETEEDAIITDSIKRLTGVTDKIEGRDLYDGKQKEFPSIFVPFISTNYKIRVNLTDQALYDRLILIPFWVKFVENPEGPLQMKSDSNLAEIFNENEFKKSILCWLIDASSYYYENENKEIPEEVIKEKEIYRQEQNIFLEFLDYEYTIIKGKTEEKMIYLINKAELIDSFINYCIRNGVKMQPVKAEKQMLKYIPCCKKEGINYFYGIKLKEK